MNQIASIWDSVEIQLLGRRGLSFAIAAKNTEWKPEPHDAACWRCAGTVGPYETDGDGCAACRGQKLPWDRAVRLGTFDGIVRDAVLDLKFRRWIASGYQLGSVLGARLSAELERNGIKPSEVRLVPVPITRRRRLRRGIDHTLVLAQGIERYHGIRVMPLLRARKRAEQIGLSATARAKNMRGAFFAIGEPHKWGEEHGNDEVRVFVVIDDVMTTGATLKAACSVVRRSISRNSSGNGAEVWSMCAAVAGGDRRVGEGDARN